MTHDEKKALAELFTKCGMQPPYPTADEIEVIVRWGLALSARLEEVEADYVSADHLKVELAGCVEERDALRVKLEEAQAETIGDAADHWFLQGGKMQFGALERKPTNPDELISEILGVVRRQLPDSPGEIVKACPQCGNNTDQRSLSEYVARGAKAWWCDACDYEYDEPAYYQKVPKP